MVNIAINNFCLRRLYFLRERQHVGVLARWHGRTEASIGVWRRDITWSTTKSQEKRMDVNEMRILRWMCGATKEVKTRIEHARGSVKVPPVTKQTTEKISGTVGLNDHWARDERKGAYRPY